jgi:hypothetical protein
MSFCNDEPKRAKFESEQCNYRPKRPRFTTAIIVIGMLLIPSSFECCSSRLLLIFSLLRA